VVHAEDLHRLTVIADGHEAGERIWTLTERQYPSDKPSVAASGGVAGRVRGGGSMTARSSSRRSTRDYDASG